MTYLDEALKNEIVRAWRDVGRKQEAAGSFSGPTRALARAQFLREIVQALDEETGRDSYTDAEHEHVGELNDVALEHAGLLAAQTAPQPPAKEPGATSPTPLVPEQTTAEPADSDAVR